MKKKKGKKKRKERFRFIKTKRRWGRKEREEKYMMEGNMSNRTQHSFVCFQVFSSLKVMGSWRGANFARFYC